jgi:outer membrane beta-barrel protein
MRKHPEFKLCFALSTLILGVNPWLPAARADDTRALKAQTAVTGPVAAPTAQNADDDAEKANVDTIKEKYWARGDQSELGVVQNRTYTKAHKWELGVFGGTVSTDPFLSVYNAGTTIGYHFSEYLAVEALYFRDWSTPSSALTTLQRQLTTQNSGNSNGATTNTNPPHDYYGGEVVASLLYGKLSVFGQSIIYYDLNLLGGLGFTATDSGTYFTEHVGIGQQVYLSQHVSLKFDYRLMHYTETLVEQVIPTQIGQSIGSRQNYSNVFVFGVSFLLGSEANRSGGKK